MLRTNQHEIDTIFDFYEIKNENWKSIFDFLVFTFWWLYFSMVSKEPPFIFLETIKNGLSVVSQKKIGTRLDRKLSISQLLKNYLVSFCLLVWQHVSWKSKNKKDKIND